MRELALFAGAGGGLLGGVLLGWRTVCAVELDPHARDVLVARQNDGCLPAFPIWDDVRTFDGRAWRGCVDVVSGGFPCQDISSANPNPQGIDGERSGLWSDYQRIVRDVRPAFVFVENVPVITARGLGRVLADLAALGFDAEWCVLGADDLGAHHRRERLWILAHAADARSVDVHIEPRRGRGSQGPGAADVDRHGEVGFVADANRRRCEGERVSGLLDGQRQALGRDIDGRGR
jgi:DNA (cytosine-5)-methyltransferase 1